jgi:hypothetical protein
MEADLLAMFPCSLQPKAFLRTIGPSQERLTPASATLVEQAKRRDFVLISVKTRTKQQHEPDRRYRPANLLLTEPLHVRQHAPSTQCHELQLTEGE